MNTRTLWQKLKSTKLWVTLAAVGVAVALVSGVDADTVTDTIKAISGAVTAIAAVITYITTEGKIDAAAVGKMAEAVDATEKAGDMVQDDIAKIMSYWDNVANTDYDYIDYFGDCDEEEDI